MQGGVDVLRYVRTENLDIFLICYATIILKDLGRLSLLLQTTSEKYEEECAVGL